MVLVACFLLPCSVGLLSCALWRPPVPSPAIPLREASAGELKALLQEREEALQTVKGLFTAQVKGPSLPIAQTVYGTLFYKRADALRLQGFDRFGGRLFDFVLGPSRYRLRLANEEQLMTGRPSELARGGGISESVRLSVLAMSGLLGVASIAPGAPVALAEEGDEYRLDVRYPEGRLVTTAPLWRQIWFDRRSLNVIREKRFTAEGELTGTLELKDFRVTGPEDPAAAAASPQPSPVLPFRVRATSGDGDARIDVTFSELHPNVPLHEGDLRLAVTPPPGENESRYESVGG